MAVRDLVSENAPVANLPVIDKIERRFRIVGCADYYMRLQTESREQYVRRFVERVTTWDQRLWLR